MGCPDRIEELSAYVDGELSSVAAAHVEAHLGSCDPCRETVERFDRLRRRFLLGAPNLGADRRDRITEGVSMAATVGPGRVRRFAPRLLAAAAVVLVGIFAVLGGGTPDTVEDLAGSDGGRKTTATAEVVRILEDGFDQSAVTVAAGSTIKWTNSSAETHRIVRALGPAAVAGEFEPGDADEVTFDEPGRYRYWCAVHDRMQGEVTVRP